MSSRSLLCSVAVALVATIGGTSTAHAGLLDRLSSNLVPQHGRLFGVFAKQRHGRTHGQEIRHIQRQLHRRIAIDHF